MQHFLLGILATLAPSVLAVAWLIWRAHGVGETSHLDLGRNR